MGIISIIKAWFEKELDDVVAPLDNIKQDLYAWMAKQEAKIEKETAKAKALMEKSTTRVEANVKASKVIKNLEALLGD